MLQEDYSIPVIANELVDLFGAEAYRGIILSHTSAIVPHSVSLWRNRMSCSLGTIREHILKHSPSSIVVQAFILGNPLLEPKVVTLYRSISLNAAQSAT